jgi:CubicO group peptidase (beta-lactamase class C family)
MTSRFRALCTIAALAALPAGLPAQTAAPLRGFDAYAQQAMQVWEVPGFAIAVVHRDSVVYARGFGVRELGKADPVDTGTTFAIASVSKAFTAALVGMLVDEGKVRWDDRVTRHLPGFELFDPYVTRELTVRDLLTHRSGLARGDLLWYATPVTREEAVRRIRFLEPGTSLRSQFGYQNVMYMAAGEVIGRTAGRTWDDVLRERLFTPLGMSASNTSTRGFAEMRNIATPHESVDDTVRVIAWRDWDNVGAAGGINSNVMDMARWVRFQLDSGRVAGRRLLTEATFIETHTPQTVIRREAPARESNPYTNFSSYGLGWFLEDYRGHQVVHHGGNLDGMTALVAMMPGQDLGVVILSNMDGSALPAILMRTVFDRYLGVRGKDWSADLLRIRDRTRATARETERKREADRVPGTAPTLPLAAYAGTYADSLYGEVTVRLADGALVMDRGPAFQGDLEHWHYNTFRARYRDRSLGRAFVNFTIGADAKVMALQAEMGGGTIEFARADKVDTIPAVRLSEAEMRAFAGSFRSQTPALTIEVTLVDGGLRLTIPGQAPYTLVAATPTRFRLAREGMGPGFFLAYTVEGGRVRSVTLEQPSPRPTVTFTPAAP